MKFQETSLLFPCLGVFLVVFSLVVFVSFCFVCLFAFAFCFALVWFFGEGRGSRH